MGAETLTVLLYLGLIPAAWFFAWARRRINSESAPSLFLLLALCCACGVLSATPYVLIEKKIILKESLVSLTLFFLYLIVFVGGASSLFSKSDTYRHYGNWWRKFLPKDHPGRK